MVCPLIRCPDPGMMLSVVSPPATARRKPLSSTLSESSTRQSGWIGPLPSAPPIPPTWLCVSTSPGITILPLASITVAPSGILTDFSSPTAMILPPRTIKTPCSISGPEIGMTRAPVMATGFS